MALTNSLVGTGGGTQIFQATEDVAITTIIFCNTDLLQTTTLTVYLIPLGGTAGDQTTILKELSLPPTETFVLDAEKFILANGDRIVAAASVNAIVAATTSYVSI